LINNVTLVGRLTRDVELRYTGSGIAVASFSVAIDRPFTNAQGERETDFINCVAWRKTAETLANFTKKGSLVGLTGRIQTRNYQNNEGRTVYITEVVAENFQMLEPKSVTDQRRSGGGDSSGSTGYSNNAFSNNNQPQQNTNYAPNNQNNYSSGFDNDPFEKNDDAIDISDDDLPF
jgi:single-strand DNA-binding protein